MITPMNLKSMCLLSSFIGLSMVFILIDELTFIN